MLKKLVKYGNSNALVLDKALLELLNIEEGSVVKIRTDGISLIITAQNMVAQGTITRTVTPQETIQEATQQTMAQFTSKPENTQAYMNELKVVFGRYGEAMKKLDAPEAQRALQELEQRFNGNRLDPKYIKANTALRQKYAPELIQMDQEVQAISQKYAPAIYQFSDKENSGKLTFAVADFKKVHEKYHHVQQQFMKLNENPDYIHESVLLAEQYHATKNSPEYIQKCTDLITKYIPEYAAYQNEIKMVAESLK